MSLAGLKGISGNYSDELVVVNDDRIGGYFKWASGDMSTQITSDPYEGIYVPPDSDDTGASGAWIRQIEHGVYNAEWWLPDTMPTDAQVQLNAMHSVIPATTARKIILPYREVTLDDFLRFSLGVEYEGHGRKAPFNGQENNIFCITVTANNAKLYNIAAGNCRGSLPRGEPGGFQVSDGKDGIIGNDDPSDAPVENVTIRDCYSYDCRVGVSVAFGTNEDETDTIIYGSRDCVVENFQGDNIGRIGISAEGAHGLHVVGGHIRMGTEPEEVGGTKRGTRLLGCRNVVFQGTRFIGTGASNHVGVSIEANKFWGFESAAKEITCDAVTTENFGVHYQIQNFVEQVNITNCKALGRDDTDTAFMKLGLFSSNDSPDICRSIKIHNNECYNTANFITFRTGVASVVDITDNLFVSNNRTGTTFFEYSGLTNDDYTEIRILRNKGIGNGTNNAGFVSIFSTKSGSEFFVKDNEFTADGSADVIRSTGDGTVNGLDAGDNPTTQNALEAANKTLGSSLWSTIRPALDTEVFGDTTA